MLANALWAGWYLFSTVVMAAFAYVYWTNRNVRGLEYLLAAAVLGSLQSLLYLLSLVAPTVTTKVIFWKLFGVLAAVVVFLWYLFVVAWTERAVLARRPTLALAGGPLAVSVGLLVTNTAPAVPGLHSLYWSSASVTTTDAFLSPIVFTTGPAAIVQSLYSLGLLVASVGLLVAFTLRSEQRLYRWRNTMLVLGGAAGLLFAVGFAFLDLPYEPHPLVYVLVNSFVVLGVVRFGNYDVVSLPENSLIEAIDGAILVYSVDGTVIELNEAAKLVLGLTDEAVGRGIVGVVELSESLPSVRGGAAGTAASAAGVADLLDGHEFTTAINGVSRTFVVRVSSLDDDGEHLGWTVLCYDVTDLRQKQQELDLLKQVLSRVLRHNVRNDLSVVKANAQMLAEETSGLQAERLQTIMDKSDNLLDASEKARTVEKLLSGERTRSEFDVVEMATDAIETTRREFPDVSFETDLPDTCPVHAHWAVSHAVENVIENAAMHNDSEDPQVVVTADCGDDHATIRVADNGPGIPYKEIEVLERREETALEHGSSIGLWLVDWIVDLSQGDIEFENTDRGCTVTVELEAAIPETDVDDEEATDLNLGIGADDD
ncbi:sensor histidine kinase [Halorientalis pallida]|uniref:histidine kinase n=1 Tax=Halorientalis pallida TaxID=2479928 RepID=A0A498L5M7_9EURY|nr:histidine kinase N-terminal 7TM domain-containing protein [Halorientalis pallida]RXK51994.1 PAS domain S-box protein [Halorientalis pallida]